MTDYYFEINPVAKPRMVRSDRWANRPAVMKYWAFAVLLRFQAKELAFELHESDMSIMFGIPMPKSWSRKKKEKMIGAPHRQTPDVDNFLKGFFDSLTKDDSTIWRLWMIEKRWAAEGYIKVNIRS